MEDAAVYHLRILSSFSYQLQKPLSILFVLLCWVLRGVQTPNVGSLVPEFSGKSQRSCGEGKMDARKRKYKWDTYRRWIGSLIGGSVRRKKMVCGCDENWKWILSRDFDWSSFYRTVPRFDVEANWSRESCMCIFICTYSFVRKKEIKGVWVSFGSGLYLGELRFLVRGQKLLAL